VTTPGCGAALPRAVVAIGLTAGACVSAGAAASATIPPALLAEARARGMARSIVEMRVPPGATEADIEFVKRRVLAGIAPTKHQVLRDLPGFPMLVLEASEATLQVLAASPDVLRVNAETIDRPQR
jgi:hypothetical protein